MENLQKDKFPQGVDFAFTGECNLRCKYCSSATTWNVDKNKALSTEEIKGVLKCLSENGTSNICFFGGEPFFHPDIHELLEYISRLHFSCEVATNGTLLERDFVKFIRELKIFKKIIQVSLDGHKAEIHDSLRGRGSFEKTVRGIRNLLTEGFLVRIRMTISKLNYLCLKEMVRFLKDELGVKNLHFGELVFSGQACKNPSEIALTLTEKYRVVKELWDLCKKEKEMRFGGSFFVHAENLRNYFLSAPHSGKKGAFERCRLFGQVMGIRPDGVIVPCAVFWEYPLGNVRGGDWKKIWMEPAKKEVLYSIAGRRMSEYERCRRCDYITFCDGGCRAVAFYDTGRIDGFSNSICEIFSGKKQEVVSRFFDAVQRY